MSTCSAPSSPARSAPIRCRSWSRGCSPSTTRWAPARVAMARARSPSSIRSGWWPFPICRWPRVRSRAGTAATSSTSRCCRARRPSTTSTPTPLRGPAGNGAEGGAARLGRATDPVLLHHERGRTTVREHAFEGIIPNPGSATARPTRWRCARNWPSTRTTSPARPAGHAPAHRGAPRQGRRRRAGTRHLRDQWLPLRDALTRFLTLDLHGAKREIADKIVKEITARLNFLNNVGLDYLSLERSADTLSGGEAQRIRLASQIGSA